MLSPIITQAVFANVDRPSHKVIEKQDTHSPSNKLTVIQDNYWQSFMRDASGKNIQRVGLYNEINSKWTSKVIITRAPAVRLRRWIMYSTACLKTTNFKICTILNFEQIMMPCSVDSVQWIQTMLCFKIEAAREATSTKQIVCQSHKAAPKWSWNPRWVSSMRQCHWNATQVCTDLQGC